MHFALTRDEHLQNPRLAPPRLWVSSFAAYSYHEALGLQAEQAAAAAFQRRVSRCSWRSACRYSPLRSNAAENVELLIRPQFTAGSALPRQHPRLLRGAVVVRSCHAQDPWQDRSVSLCSTCPVGDVHALLKFQSVCYFSCSVLFEAKPLKKKQQYNTRCQLFFPTFPWRALVLTIPFLRKAYWHQNTYVPGTDYASAVDLFVLYKRMGC